MSLGDFLRYFTINETTPEVAVAQKKADELELYECVKYAKYVHDSFLTPEDEIKEIFPESFLIYNAQKIISGDFYRVGKKRGKSFIVLGDSTGHGISASYMSIMVLNILSRIAEQYCCNLSRMLTVMHEEILSATKQNKKSRIIESADTMLCTFDYENMKLNYASAKIRAVIVRSGKIIELKKDSCSIGEFSSLEFSIQNHQQDLQKGDCLYLFSDGMTDQFGGIQDKKFGYKRLLEALQKNSALPFAIQKRNIERELNEWRGNNEQTDDMTLLGVKID